MNKLLVVSIACFLITAFGTIGMAEDTFEIVTGDNEVSSIEQVQVSITYSAQAKTIADLRAEYKALQAEKAYLTELYKNATVVRNGAIAEMASIVLRGGEIDARMASLVSLRDAILAAAAGVVLNEPEPEP